MGQEHQIIGRWSADDIYSAGAQSDEILMFLPGGQGVFEVLNFGLYSYDLFEWSVADSSISIHGSKYVDKDVSGDLVEDSIFVFDNLPFTIVYENTPKGVKQEVLTIAFPTWPSNKYARVLLDVSDYQVPFDV